MRIDVITIFPMLFEAFSTQALLRLASEAQALTFACTDPRDLSTDKHRSVDDTPYGGGSGMVMQPEPIVLALEKVDPSHRAHRVLMTPRGKLFRQADAHRLAAKTHLCFVCGRYEGVDQRVADFVDEELSIGDFVLAGGEAAAMCMIEAIVRLLDGVLGNEASIQDESHTAGLLEYPQYTRPRNFRGFEVPEVLLSGDHQAIARWRREQALLRTRDYRPDLIAANEDKKGAS